MSVLIVKCDLTHYLFLMKVYGQDRKTE